jgi:4-alpha-glucanotransferase
VAQRAAGILLHPTSLPGPHGIGELGAEATAFLDFLGETGQSVWQVLPLGPTGTSRCSWPSRTRTAGGLVRVGAAAAAARSGGDALKPRRAAGRTRPEIERQRLWQWWFDRHWSDVRAAAAERDVAIMGDLPDLRRLRLGRHLGRPGPVPPRRRRAADGGRRRAAGLLLATGQRWGNPLYRWDAPRRTGFAWWVARVKRSLELVDVLRIDHFRGFEAYWEIPADEPTAVKGRWVKGPASRSSTP